MVFFTNLIIMMIKKVNKWLEIKLYPTRFTLGNIFMWLMAMIIIIQTLNKGVRWGPAYQKVGKFTVV